MKKESVTSEVMKLAPINGGEAFESFLGEVRFVVRDKAMRFGDLWVRRVNEFMVEGTYETYRVIGYVVWQDLRAGEPLILDGEEHGQLAVYHTVEEESRAWVREAVASAASIDPRRVMFE